MRIGRLDKAEGRDVSSPHAAGASRTGERGLASHRGSSALKEEAHHAAHSPSALTLAARRSLLAVVLGVGLVDDASRPRRRAPPPWKQGQPADMANSPLAPIAQPPSPKAPGEIPVAKIKLPPGFKAELWAHGINNARAMTWGDKGTLFVSSRVAGNVYAVVDKGGQREVKVIAKGLNLPNGVAFKDGTLYVAEISRITKMPGIEDKLDNPPAMEVVYDILPRDLPHGWKYLAFGPDGKLYFNIGAPVQYLHPAGHPRQYLARQRRRQRLRVLRPRRAQ